MSTTAAPETTPAHENTSSAAVGGSAPVSRSAVLPTVRGWIVLALGVALVATGAWASYPGLVAVGLGLLAISVIALVLLMTSPRPVVRRELSSPTVVRLQPAGVTLVIDLPRGVDLRDLSAEDTVGGDSIAIPLTADGSTHHTIPLATSLPGTIALGPFRVRQVSLAGLWRQIWQDGSVDSLIVVPRRLPTTLPPTGAMPVTTTAADRLEGSGTDLRSLREYSPGDDLRRVSPYASARYGKLIVREDGDPSILSVAVLVDNAEEHPADEYAEMLDIAASLCQAAVRQEMPCTWASRSTPPDVVDPSSIERTVVDLGLLARSDDPMHRASVGDFTIIVTATGSDPLALVQSAAAHGDHRIMAVVSVDMSGDSNADQVAHAVAAATAEDAIRAFEVLGRTLASR